jgi:hypothetical protein
MLLAWEVYEPGMGRQGGLQALIAPLPHTLPPASYALLARHVTCVPTRCARGSPLLLLLLACLALGVVVTQLAESKHAVALFPELVILPQPRADPSLIGSQMIGLGSKLLNGSHNLSLLEIRP